MRGAKLFLSGLTRLFPNRELAGVNFRPVVGSRFVKRLRPSYGQVAKSYRIPRFMVNFDVTFQSSWKKPENIFRRESTTAKFVSCAPEGYPSRKSANPMPVRFPSKFMLPLKP